MGDVLVAKDAIRKSLGMEGDLIGVIACGFGADAPTPRDTCQSRPPRETYLTALYVEQPISLVVGAFTAWASGTPNRDRGGSDARPRRNRRGSPTSKRARQRNSPGRSSPLPGYRGSDPMRFMSVQGAAAGEHQESLPDLDPPR